MEQSGGIMFMEENIAETTRRTHGLLLSLLVTTLNMVQIYTIINYALANRAATTVSALFVFLG